MNIVGGFFIMKKLLVTLAVLGLFIGGTQYKGYDFFIFKFTNKAPIGLLMKKGEKLATVTGKDLTRFYERLVRERQEKVKKDMGQGGTEI